jgi:hypothetical protein
MEKALMEKIGCLAVSPARAATLIGVSRSKFYELLNVEIPSRKCGSRTLVLVSDIEKYLGALPHPRSKQKRPSVRAPGRVLTPERMQKI